MILCAQLSTLWKKSFKNSKCVSGFSKVVHILQIMLECYIWDVAIALWKPMKSTRFKIQYEQKTVQICVLNNIVMNIRVTQHYVRFLYNNVSIIIMSEVHHITAKPEQNMAPIPHSTFSYMRCSLNTHWTRVRYKCYRHINNPS